MIEVLAWVFWLAGTTAALGYYNKHTPEEKYSPWEHGWLAIVWPVFAFAGIVYIALEAMDTDSD